MKVAPRYDGHPRVGRSDGAQPVCDASYREDRMALKLEEKKVVVAEVNAVAAKALSVVGAENRGLTVTQMTDLRAKARKEGVYLRIVKNTLARKAVAGTRFRVHCSGAERTHCPRVLQGRSGRGRAHRQGVCEGQRQAGDDARVAGRAIAQARRTSSAWLRCPRARRRCRSCWVCSRRRLRSSSVRWPRPTRSWCARWPPFLKRRRQQAARLGGDADLT